MTMTSAKGESFSFIHCFGQNSDKLPFTFQNYIHKCQNWRCNNLTENLAAQFGLEPDPLIQQF